MKAKNKSISFAGLVPKAVLFFAEVATSVAAFAGAANVNVYWTRGFDGTGTFGETTTNKVFIEDGGSVFTDRLISGANQISDVDAMGVMNTVSGARLDESVTADYANDGSAYLHLGYINSGFTGSGSEIQSINLNGDLVVGRLAIENTYNRNGETIKNANFATVMSAGDSDYTITFDYSGTANELFFFRGNGGTTSAAYSTTFTLDSNVDIVSGLIGTDDPSKSYYLFNVSANNHLVLGSEDHQRTFTARDTGNWEDGIFTVYGCGSLTSYSDMVINGAGRYVFCGQGSFYLYGDITWEVKDAPDYVSFMTMWGDDSTAYPAGEAIIDGNITMDVTTTKSALDGFYVNRAGNVLTMNGDVTIKNANPYSGFSLFLTKAADQTINLNGKLTVDKVGMLNGTSRLFHLNGEKGNVSVSNTITINDTGTRPFFIYDDSPASGLSGNNKIVSTGDIIINSITSSDFEIIRMNGENGTAVFDGDLYINNKTENTSTAYGYRIYNKSGLNLTVNGDINLNGKYKGYLFSVGSGVVDSEVNMYGDISIMDGTSTTSLFYNNSTSTLINFYGDITVTNNVSCTNLLGGNRAVGSVTNFYGRLDTTGRTVETSFASTNQGSIINLRGSVDNTFNNIGLRTSIFNLLNANDSAALNVQTYMGFGANAKVNVFGQNQIKLTSQTEIYLWTATDGIAGTINLNGSNLDVGGLYFVGSSRSLVIDFGMSDHGMSNEQLEAFGITTEMINATGAGVSQVFSIGGVRFRDDTSLEDCYILFENYAVGEDKILSYVKLSEVTINGRDAYSESVLEDNLFRIAGYMDSEKYGVDYYLAELETTDSYGAQCWEYYIIPEPSEVAALIGALALGFALLHRRRV